jgi:hypothetical protein
MKSTFIFIAGLIVGYVFTITGCNAQTTYLYGPQGQSLGTAFQSGNTTYYYGAQGQSQGTASQYGNTTYYYGPQGQGAGTVTSPTTPTYSPAPIYNPTPSSTYNSMFRR